MKIIRTVLLLLIALLLLASCTTADPADTGSETKSKDPAQTTAKAGNEFAPGYIFRFGSTDISVGTKAVDTIAALGEAKNKTVSTGCANFDGMTETVYYYNSFRITTHEMNGEEIITSVYLEDDTVSTPEGIFLGKSASSLEVYGEKDPSSTDNQIVFAKGDMTLTFILKEDSVNSILYSLTV